MRKSSAASAARTEVDPARAERRGALLRFRPSQRPPSRCGALTTQSDAATVTVKANDGGAVSECKDGNNEGVVLDVYCKPTG